jgi:hypothetical protein
MADGQRQAIDKVLSAGSDRLDPQLVVGYLLGLEYLKTLPDIGKEGDRIFLPYEASSVLGAVGSIEALLKGKV